MTRPPPRRDRRTAMKDVIDAVRANCAGKSRDEVEQLLRDELAERGVDYPEPLIGAAADVLAHPPGLLSQVRMLRFGMRTLAQMGAASTALSDVLAERGVAAINDPADETSAWVDVLLDEDGKGVLRSRRERLSLPADARDQIAGGIRLATTHHSGVAGNPAAPGQRSCAADSAAAASGDAAIRCAPA